jgi:hypothetical protein
MVLQVLAELVHVQPQFLGVAGQDGRHLVGRSFDPLLIPLEE